MQCSEDYFSIQVLDNDEDGNLFEVDPMTPSTSCGGTPVTSSDNGEFVVHISDFRAVQIHFYSVLFDKYNTGIQYRYTIVI